MAVGPCPSSPGFACSAWTCVSIASVIVLSAPHAVESIRLASLHFRDLRHTGNHSKSGAGLRDLMVMARMGRDSDRAAMIYQHGAWARPRGA